MARWKPGRRPPSPAELAKEGEEGVSHEIQHATSGRIVLYNKTRKKIFASLERGALRDGSSGWYEVGAGGNEVWKRCNGSYNMRMMISSKAHPSGAYPEGIGEIDVDLGDYRRITINFFGDRIRTKAE